MKIHDCEQGTPEWLELRKGIPTASDASKLVSNTGKISTQIVDYSRELAAELHGVVFPHYTNAAMERGTELEAEARANYSLDFGAVKEVGFITNDEETFGYSPDGLVGEDGLIEIKCINFKKHCDLLVSGKYPIDYNAQIQTGLWITGRAWCDLVLYYPGIPMITHRVEPDPGFHNLLEMKAGECISMRDEFLQNVLHSDVQASVETEIEVEF